MNSKNLVVLLVILFVIICNGCIKQNTTIQNNKAIARQFVEAWNMYDSVKVASLFSDDFIYQDLAFGFKISGNKSGLINFVHGTIKGAPDLHFKINSVVASDSIAVTEWTWTGTFTGGWGEEYPANNKPFTIEGISLMNIENGQIKHNKDFYDNKPFRKTIESN